MRVNPERRPKCGGVARVIFAACLDEADEATCEEEKDAYMTANLQRVDPIPQSTAINTAIRLSRRDEDTRLWAPWPRPPAYLV